MSQRCAVFAGPSLPQALRVVRPWITYFPSAARGDVERASHSFDAILMIDSVFLEELAPSPKEVRTALDRISFFGAASAGALRALECAPFGAVALGTIARWYARGVIEGDDEIALVFDPLTGMPLSVPLVNVRYFLNRAYAAGFVTRLQCGEMFAAARAVFFADRTWDDVFDPLHEKRRAELRRFAENECDLKQLDARFAVDEVIARLR